MSDNNQSWATLESAFSKALQNPAESLPVGIASYEDGAQPVKRFNVYRNNVALSLITVLKDVYPVVMALVGEEFFQTLARHFSARHLPETPMMFQYGAALPAFIETYEPARQIPYLPAIAALEWARNEALYSADAATAKLEELTTYEEEDIPNLFFELHPAVKLVKTPWPIVSIWQAHQTENGEAQLSDLPDEAQTALITRPELTVWVTKISPSSAVFITRLQDRQTFGSAVEAAVEKDPAFDISTNLAKLFSLGAVTSISQ